MPAIDPYTIRPAQTDDDLRGILSLQDANHFDTLAPSDRLLLGFVSLRHDLALLREMNSPDPHLLATNSGRVVAYALVTRPEFRGRIPLLDPMFEHTDRLASPGGPLHALRWYVMGQVCVDPAHRGRGLVSRLYAGHRERMSARFDAMVSEIDLDNARSLRAHEKAGFVRLLEYPAPDGRRWAIVSLDLRD